ncbi:hypothetical protein ACHAWF_009797 [Thalassiosira exigua]
MSLWPCALCQAACNDYLVPQHDEELSKLDLFGNLRVNDNLKSVHTFGCLVYVLDSMLVSGKSIKPWDSQARLGLNLGQSPSNTHNVSLVLSLATGSRSTRLGSTSTATSRLIESNTSTPTGQSSLGLQLVSLSSSALPSAGPSSSLTSLWPTLKRPLSATSTSTWKFLMASLSRVQAPRTSHSSCSSTSTIRSREVRYGTNIQRSSSLTRPTIFIYYTDDDIVLKTNGKNPDNFVQEFIDAKLKVEDIGHPNDYVGVNIQRQSDGTFHYVRTAFIDQIIADCGLTNSSTKKKQVPVKCQV